MQKIITFLNKKHFLVLLLLFIFSALLRTPGLNRGLTWNEVTFLIPVEIWQKQGAIENNFNPIDTYPGDANKNIISRMADAEGNSYYTSYPPFVFIAPFLTFKLLGVTAGSFSLRAFNLVVIFISILLIYHLVLYLFKHRGTALFAAIAYMFSYVIFYQAFNYTPESFVTWIFILGIYLSLKIVNNDYNKLVLAVFPITIFLMAYTDWIGFLFPFVVFVYSLINKNRIKLFWYLISVVTLLPMLSLGFTLWQYSLINGFDGLFNYFLGKYSQRSLGLVGEEHPYTGVGIFLDPNSYTNIAQYYLYGFFGQIASFLVLLILLVLADKFTELKSIFKENKSRILPAICFSVLPIVIHHIVLFQTIVTHTTSMQKSATFVVILLSWCFYTAYKLILNNKIGLNLKKFYLTSFTVLIFVSALFSLKSQGLHYSDGYESWGKFIREEAKDDEVVFLEGIYPTSQFDYYSKRNVAGFSMLENSYDLIKKNGLKKGIIFYLDDNSNFAYRRVSL